MIKDNYFGVYDYKESDTFRPTLEERIHKNHPYSKTICTRSDSCCVMFSGGGKMEQDLRIRKLTPKECGRLMGVKDEEIELILENQTSASAYHLFGDSIVTTCLMAIFSQMIPNKNWEANQWTKKKQ